MNTTLLSRASAVVPEMDGEGVDVLHASSIDEDDDFSSQDRMRRHRWMLPVKC